MQLVILFFILNLYGAAAVSVIIFVFSLFSSACNSYSFRYAPVPKEPETVCYNEWSSSLSSPIASAGIDFRLFYDL